MNTDDNIPKSIPTDAKGYIGREIISVLNSCTIDLSIEQTLQELQIAVERLTFGSQSIGNDLTLNDIDSLLNGDVSPHLMSFLRWLHHKRILRLLVGDNGRRMLSYCSEYYRSVKQVRVSTAIPLRESFRITLLQYLRIRYPEPTRIVFETSPGLLAGCVIDDGIVRSDMSLQNKSPDFISEYLASRRGQERGSV
jgi:hypothetical protein